MFVDPVLLSRVSEALGKAGEVRNVVFNEEAVQAVDEREVEEFRKRYPKVALYSFSDFLASADESIEPAPPETDDLACIMYTSGSKYAREESWVLVETASQVFSRFISYPLSRCHLRYAPLTTDSRHRCT